jgi:hypothetical protein
MNALLFVAGGAPPTWSVSERKAGGRRLGTVQHWGKTGFFIEPASSGPLSRVERGPYEGLDEAMAAIADHLRGTCEEWAPRVVGLPHSAAHLQL